ncbi:MAG: hypothetical protein A2Z15_01000 [Chloroflexi bacterium RBG_16_50_11]|nr:MAG: hypothetical protein A2Z15_01000 [Chloroflexi bacterium RBG_16_50_11]
MITTLLFFTVALLAAVMASVTGFGVATLTVPFLAWIIDIKQAIILIAFFHGFSSLFKLVQLRRHVDVRTVLWYGFPAVITAVIGAYLLDIVAPVAIGLGIGVFLILFALSSLLNVSWKLPERKAVLVTGGIVSGFISGLIGLGGAIRGAFLITTGQKKETYIATSAAIALFTDVARTVTYVTRDSLESRYYWFIPVLLVISFIGTWSGVKLLKWLPELIVKRVVLAVLVLVSVSFILDYFEIINTG